MPRATNSPITLTPAYANGCFTAQDDTLLYESIPRVPVDELRTLLSRGSGYVVRESLRPKEWFQAQCAHYGLGTRGTLAALRERLEGSLGLFQGRTREKAEREKERLAMGKKSEAIRSSIIRRPHSGSISSQKCAGATTVPRIPPKVPAPNPTKNVVPPRTSLPAMTSVAKPTRRNSELKTFEQAKLSMKFSESNSSGTDTESESDNSSSVSEPRVTFPPPGLPSPLLNSSRLRGNRAQSLRLEDDIVSGRWELHVTERDLTPLPVSPKWLQGDMNVHLSCDRRALTAEFALFGVDGTIKSRMFYLHTGGVYALVDLVTVTTAEGTRGVDLEDTRVFGLPVMHDVQLWFSKEGTIEGILMCGEYEGLKFKGARVRQAS
ncbi:hypothetical protein FRC10_004850 [Ceratobasidium sp. 414]|nr:hypothetical protein FRC10_004850 [Ceratobasidium sp. 414]